MTHRRALFLSSVMMRGYGVSVVADEIAQRIGAFGWDVMIGSLSIDETYRAKGVVEIAADPSAVAQFCRTNGIAAVIAQTTPYFEVLPALCSEFPTIVFEHGDPSPHFFDKDAEERQRIRLNKISNVYPHVTRVLASSHFLRHDIEWLSAAVVPLGCDHVPDPGPKDLTLTVQRLGRPLRVGTLMRLGDGESRYKGVELFADLIEATHEHGGIEFAIMGRGTDADRDRWESLGVEVHLNATDEARAAYLRGLDVLFSPSLWEGFNLPLVEAQASGTVGVAFDVGAHPETTPFLASNLEDAARMLRAWNNDRNQLERASLRSYRFARAKFRWDTTARLLANHLDEVVPPPQPTAPPGRWITRLMRLEGLVRREGAAGAARVIVQRTAERLRPR
jgi:glycosyltransferase involved in cell wall biosynthesis